MASFDIKSLFTNRNLPLAETLNLWIQNQPYIGNLTKSLFYDLVKINLFESFFIFERKFYEPWDGVAMGSPVAPTLANVFICHFGSIWLENCQVI